MDVGAGYRNTAEGFYAGVTWGVLWPLARARPHAAAVARSPRTPAPPRSCACTWASSSRVARSCLVPRLMTFLVQRCVWPPFISSAGAPSRAQPLPSFETAPSVARSPERAAPSSTLIPRLNLCRPLAVSARPRGAIARAFANGLVRQPPSPRETGADVAPDTARRTTTPLTRGCERRASNRDGPPLDSAPRGSRGYGVGRRLESGIETGVAWPDVAEAGARGEG